MKQETQTSNTKTIDITCLEWFDKINGNSYFAAQVTVNYGMPDEFMFALPFQYGYGDHYKDMAAKELNKRGYLPGFDEQRQRLWSYAADNKIIVRTVKHENCKKRELKNISE